MSLVQAIKNLFRKGGVALGMVNHLGSITDDPRISIPSSEYSRVRVAKKYYADDFRDIDFTNSYGDVKKRHFMSLNMAKLSSRRLASIIFNEQCKVTVNDSGAETLLENIFQNCDFYLTYEEYLEKYIALGWGFIRPYVENDQIKLAWGIADQFYPLKTNTNEVNEAAIASVTQRTEHDTTAYYTLLEFHQWQQDGTYQISYELYRSENSEEVGDQIALNTLDEYANLQPTISLTGLKYPLFAYFKTPGANNKCIESPLGLGIVDNAKRIIDAINMTNDQFFWEVKMGKRRVAVPAEMLRGISIPNGSFGSSDTQAATSHPPLFDADESVYQGMYGADDMKITDLTSPIRNAQYQAALDYYLHEFENAVGLSQGTFTTTPSGVQTATEVVSNNSMTYQTRSSYLTQVQKQITSLVRAVLELASCRQLFSDGKALWTGNVDDVEVNIDFNDGVFVDKDKQATQDMLAVQQGVLSRKTFLKRNYEMSDEQADAELAQVKAEAPDQPAGESQQEGLLSGGDE